LLRLAHKTPKNRLTGDFLRYKLRRIEGSRSLEMRKTTQFPGELRNAQQSPRKLPGQGASKPPPVRLHFRQPAFFLALFLNCLSFGSCGDVSVLGLSPGEAADRLKQGDIGFLLALDAKQADLEKLARIHPSAPFYAGLAIKDTAPGIGRVLFETALGSPNAFVREGAVEELFGLIFRGEALPPPLLARLQKENPALWAKTLGAAAKPESREKILSLFLDPPDGPPAEALPYLLEELRRQNPGFLTPADEAALEGHLAVSRSSFAEGLQFFRPLAEEDRALFFRHPELLNDLGRCFQYAAAGDEGTGLFLAWEKELAGTAAEFSPAAQDAIRFRLLFFAGRIARQRGQISRGAELFTGALPFAPDPLQADACVWYILDAVLQASPEKAASLAIAYMPRWNDRAYFADILDRLAQYLTVNRDWGALALLLEEMQKPAGAGASASGQDLRGPLSAPDSSIAQYAWIIGRARSEGLYRPPEAVDSGARGDAGPALAGSFFRLAYQSGGASLYYRALGASFLGESFLDLPAHPPRGKTGEGGGKNRELMAFLDGFFEYGGAAFALPRILAHEKELSVPELRSLAGELTQAGRYPETLRLVSRFMKRPDYRPNRADLELYYPRPFQKLIEQTARDAGLRRELLFGLIHTESAFQPEIISRAGAVGLAQLMPATAADMAGRVKNRGGTDYTENNGPDLRDPAVNVHLGAVYLRYLSDRLENPFLAILAYNGGMNRVRRWRNGEQGLPADLFLETIPYAETREYGRKVLAAALAYGYLYYDLKIRPFFSDMLKSE
jgi:soluble lytic murein transglycosylase